MTQIATPDLNNVLEALRAVRDPSVNVQGLEALRQALQSSGGATCLAELLSKSPYLHELLEIWEVQLTAKNDEVIVALLLLLAEMLPLLASMPSLEHTGASTELISYLLDRRLKALYFYLSSDSKPKSCAALVLLSAVARHSVQSARQLAHSFDFSLSALAKLCRLPREKKDEGGEETHSRLLEAWQATEPTERPTVSLFVDFALSLLAHADAALLQRLLPIRVLWFGLLSHLASFPPPVVQQILSVIQDGVLSLGSDVPASVRAQAFSDSALAQLAEVAAWRAEGAPAEVAACAGAAQHTLLELLTNPSHGIAPPADSDVWDYPQDNQPSRRRVLRLLHSLKPTSLKAHYDVLLTVARHRPDLGSAYLASCQLSLDPKPGLRWLAGSSLLGTLIHLTPDVDFLALATRQARQDGQPSQLLLAQIRKIFPSPLAKGILTKGLQSSNSLVRQATLSTLCNMLSALERTLLSLERAQKHAQQEYDILSSEHLLPAESMPVASKDTPSAELPMAEEGAPDLAEDTPDHPNKADNTRAAAEQTEPEPQIASKQSAAQDLELAAAAARFGAWKSLCARLRSAASAKLPDLQTLMALHAGLPRSQVAQLAADDAEPGSVELSGSDLILLHLMKVLQGYTCCLPALCSEARFNAWQLLPQDAASMHPSLQHAVLSLLQNSLDSTEGAAGTMHATAEQLASLLQMLQLSDASSPVSELAYGAAQGYLQQTIGFDNLAEVHLWLGSLPNISSGGDPARVSAAVTKFLAEATALLLRKPHEMWELQQGITDAAITSNSTSLDQPDASLLPITVLRQAIRVAGSSKMPEAATTAICSYVKGALEMLLRVQADRKPLSTIITQVIECHGSASAASSLPEGLQCNAQTGQPSATGRPPFSSSAEDANKITKRPKRGASSVSPLQAASETNGTGGQSRAPVSADRAGSSSGRKRVRKAGSPGAELASPPQGSGAAWEVLQRLRTEAKAGSAAPEAFRNQDGGDGGLRALFRAIDCLPGVDPSRLIDSIAQVPIRQRAVPVLALVCVLHSEAMRPFTADLFKGVRFCLMEREGEDTSRDRLAFLSAVLKHPSLLNSYLAGSSQHGKATQDAMDSCTGELLAQILDHAEAAERPGNGQLSSTQSGVLAAAQPYLSRTLHLLEEVAASCSLEGFGQARPPYLPLAKHLSFEPAAAAAAALLDLGRQKGIPDAEATWRTAHGMGVAAGLLTHTAVRADPLAALSQHQTPGLLSSIAGAIRMDARAAQCLIDLLQAHTSVQGLLAWQLAGQARAIVEFAVASPSEAPCQLAAILLRALPLNHFNTLHTLLQHLLGIGLPDLARLLLVIRATLSVQTRQGSETRCQQLASAAFKVLLEWITDSNPKQTGKLLLAPAGQLSGPAADSLLQHAVPVLELCLERQHLDHGQMLQLLRQLAYTEAWSWRDPQSAYGSASAAHKVALSSTLVTKLAAQDPSVQTAGDAVACFGMSVLATSARLIRRQDAEGAEKALIEQLEAIMGGLLPELMSKQPLQRWQLSTQSALLAALRKLAIAVLRHRYRSPEHLRLLRGLLASLLRAGPSTCPAASDLAANLAELVVLHSDFQSLMAQSSAEPLPKAAAQLAVPMTSLLPLVSVHDDPHQQAVAAKKAMLELLTVIAGSSRIASARLAAHWDSLAPALLMGYGATLSSTDQAALRLLCVLSAARRPQHVSARADADEPASALQAWMSEGAAGVGFVFGGAAKALLEMGLLNSSPEQGMQRAKVLKDALAIDARRCSLSVVHWPEEYLQSLSTEMSTGEKSMGNVIEPQQHTTHPAGYNPAFLLPFTLQVIREQLLPCLDIATSGLLALVLRGLACGSAAFRSCSYEALALYKEALEQCNFREKTQLSMLMSLTRQTLQEPLQRLPALTAVYLAEASCALTHPGCELFPAVSRHLLRKPSLDLQEAPLLKQLLSSSSPAQAAERLWLARLLAAGFQDQTEGDIFRRQFVGELLMSIYSSALADAELATAIEGVMCNICMRAPTYAADLVQQAGLVSWLSAAIASKVQLHLESDGTREAVYTQPADHHAVRRLLAALQALLNAKEWQTATKVGSLGALDVFAEAANRLLAALAETCMQWWTVSGAAAVLQYALDLQLQVNSSWEEEVRQPRWQPWRSLTCLLSAQEAIPEAHKALLLQFILASPSPCEDGARSFAAIACWSLDTAHGLCQHVTYAPAVPHSLRGDVTSKEKDQHQSQPAATLPEPCSLAAQVLPWLALCLASQASAPSPALAATALSMAVEGSALTAAVRQARGLHQKGSSALPLAARLVQLYLALEQDLRALTAPAAAFALAQLLQPDITPLLMGNAATQRQVKGSAEWRFLLGNTLLRMLSHLKLDQVQLQTWQQLARSSQALSTAASRQLSPVKAEEQAALEMLLVMLPEFCMQQAPVLTGQTLSEWKAGRDGLLKQKLAELEIRHARAVGLVLQP